jgi:DNA-binding NarL/FixJ family response regulator
MGIRVLIADDQAVVRAGFQTLLRREPDIDVVGEAADGLEAVRAVGRTDPDVVLMDVRMPGLDGLEATRRLVAARSGDRPRVLIVTTFDLDEYVFAALRAGASGFLLKNVSPAALAEAVRTVHGGESLLAPSVTTRMIRHFVRSGPAGRVPGAVDRLTARERDVFQLLARGLSNAEIARRLSVGEGTVKTHVGNVLLKLGLRDRVQAVVYAYENGLVRPGER